MFYCSSTVFSVYIKIGNLISAGLVVQRVVLSVSSAVFNVWDGKMHLLLEQFSQRESPSSICAPVIRLWCYKQKSFLIITSFSRDTLLERTKIKSKASLREIAQIC